MYGKIQLASEGESVEKLVGQLDVILKRFGYPEKKAEEAEEKDKEESKAIDEAINKAKPARDSVIDLVKKEIVPEEENVVEEDEDVDDFHPDDEP